MSNSSTSDILFKALDGQINIDSAQGIVECFVAAIGNKDSVGDVIVSGAFTESLKRRKPRVVWGHNWNDPIGKVLEIYEVPANDPRIPTKMRMAGVGGLYSRVQFNLATEKGREAFASVAFFGHEQEWSIGYKTLQATFDPTMQANVLREVELYEVSPVLHGANQLTATLSVKSDETGEKCGPGGGHGPAMMDIPRFNLMPLNPASFASQNERTDIFAEGEAGQLGNEARTALELELSSRSSSPITVISATENSVIFDRGMPNGSRVTYRIPYHHETTTGQYMFGKPEKMASQQIIPSQMPSMPMMVKPGYVTNSYGDPQQPISMMKSFDEQLDQAIGILSNAGEDETVKENELQKIQDAIDYLRKLSSTQNEKAALEYSVWCKPQYAYQVKSLLDPVINYHRLEAHVDDYGVHITSGLNDESLQAVRSAHKNIVKFLDGGGGSKKDRGASNTKAAPKTKVKALGGNIGPKLGGGLRSAPKGMAFVDITGVTDADSDGIVFEGKPGLERPIIPRFFVPKELARKLSSIVEGDAEAIEKQRRSGNGNVSFDEKKLRSIIDDIGGDPNLLQNISRNDGREQPAIGSDLPFDLGTRKPRQMFNESDEDFARRSNPLDLIRPKKSGSRSKTRYSDDENKIPGKRVFADRDDQYRVYQNDDGTYSGYYMVHEPGRNYFAYEEVDGGPFRSIEFAKKAARVARYNNEKLTTGRKYDDERDVPGKKIYSVYGDNRKVSIFQDDDGLYYGYLLNGYNGEMNEIDNAVFETEKEATSFADRYTQRPVNPPQKQTSRRDARKKRREKEKQKPTQERGVSVRDNRNFDIDEIPGRLVDRYDDGGNVRVYQNEDGTYSTYKEMNIPGTEGGYWRRTQDKPSDSINEARDTARNRGFRSRSDDGDIEAELDEQSDRQFRENRLGQPRKKPKKSVAELRKEYEKRKEESRLKRQRDAAENDTEAMLDEWADNQRNMEREDRGFRSSSQRRITLDETIAQRAREVLEDNDIDPRELFQGDNESTKDYLDRITPLIEKYAPQIFDGRSLDEFVSENNNSEVNKLIDNAYSNHDLIREGLDVRVFKDGMGDPSESRLYMEFIDTEVDVADNPAGSFLRDSGLVDYIETEGYSDGDWSWSIDVDKASPEEKKRFVASAVSDAIMANEGSWGRDGFVLRDKNRGMRSSSGPWDDGPDYREEPEQYGGFFLPEEDQLRDLESRRANRKAIERLTSEAEDAWENLDEDEKYDLISDYAERRLPNITGGNDWDPGDWEEGALDQFVNDYISDNAPQGMRSRIGDALRDAGREVGKDLKREAKKFAKNKGRELLDDAVDSIFDRNRRNRGMRSRGMSFGEPFSDRRPDKQLNPRGRGPVPSLRDMTDDELKELLASYSKKNPRPWDRNQRIDLDLFDITGRKKTKPSLNSLIQELDSRGYDVFQTRPQKAKYFGDYASGDENIYARKRGEKAPDWESMFQSEASTVSETVSELEDQATRDSANNRSSRSVPDDYVPSESALSSLSDWERLVATEFKPLSRAERMRRFDNAMKARRDADAKEFNETGRWPDTYWPDFDEWDKSYKDKLRRYRKIMRKAHAKDVEDGVVKPQSQRGVDNPLGLSKSIMDALLNGDFSRPPRRLSESWGPTSQRYRGFRSAISDSLREIEESLGKPRKEERAFEILSAISQRGGQKFGLSDSELQNIFDGGSKIEPSLMKIVRSELKRQGFTQADIDDVMSGAYSGFARSWIEDGHPPVSELDWLSEIWAIENRAEIEAIGVLSDGLTEDEFREFMSTGKIPQGKESVIRRSEEVYDNIVKDKDLQRRMGMRSRGNMDINSAINENIKKQKELEKELDDGKIDLDEFRRRQIPLRKEFAELRSEQSRQSPMSVAGKPELDATGRPRRGMVERDTSGKVKFDSQAFLAEQDRKRRARMSELGFTDDEINSLLGKPNQPVGMRSRSGMRSSNSYDFKQSDSDTRDMFINGRHSEIAQTMNDLVAQRAELSDKLDELQQKFFGSGREMSPEEEQEWSDIEDQISAVTDKIDGMANFLNYAQGEDIQRRAGKRSVDKARSEYKRMLDNDEISQEDYEKLVADLIYPEFFDEEYWDSKDAISVHQAVRSSIGRDTPYDPFLLSKYDSEDDIVDAIEEKASGFADEMVADGLKRLREGGMRSRSGKKKKPSGPSRKLTPEQVRISQEQKLRSKKVPGKKKEGPSKHEWGFRSLNDYGDANNETLNHLSSIFSKKDNDLTTDEKYLRDYLLSNGIKFDFSRDQDGNIFSDISLRENTKASPDEKLDALFGALFKDKISSDFLSNRGFVVDDRYKDNPSYSRKNKERLPKLSDSDRGVKARAKAESLMPGDVLPENWDDESKPLGRPSVRIADIQTNANGDLILTLENADGSVSRRSFAKGSTFPNVSRPAGATRPMPQREESIDARGRQMGFRSRRSYDDEGGSGGVREGVAESKYNSGSKWIDRLEGDNVDAEVIPLADIYGDDTPGYGVVGRYRTDYGEEWFYGGTDDEEFDSVEDAMDFLQNIEDQGNDDVFYDDPKFRSLDRVRSAGKPGRRPLEGLRSRQSNSEDRGSRGVREGIGDSQYLDGSEYVARKRGENVDAEVVPLRDLYGDDRPGYAVVGRFRTDNGFDYFYGGENEEFDTLEDAADFLQNIEEQGSKDIFYDDPRFRSLDRVRSAGKPGRRPLAGLRSQSGEGGRRDQFEGYDGGTYTATSPVGENLEYDRRVAGDRNTNPFLLEGSPTHLDNLARSDDKETRLSVAGHPNTAGSTLYQLLRDEDDDVKKAADKEIVKRLTEMANEEVPPRNPAARKRVANAKRLLDEHEARMKETPGMRSRSNREERIEPKRQSRTANEPKDPDGPDDPDDVEEISSGMRSRAGTGLGESREIYPSRRMGESSAVSYVRYDAAREELVVQYKGGGTYTFGGISAADADAIEEAESLGKALNDAKRNATYTVKPNGDISGVQSETADFLERDLRRIPMSEDERKVYNNAINLLRGGVKEDSDFNDISQQVSRISDLGNEMWGNEEYAAANFLYEAAENINKKVNSARGQGGFRSRAAARHQRMEVNLSADEIGEMRDEIRQIMSKHDGNPLITYGLKKYDGLLEEWQGQKKSNPGRPLTVLSSEYDTIMSSYDELEKNDPEWTRALSADPLEMASISKEGKFSSPNVQSGEGGFNGKRINNGAPEDITPRMQGQLIDWGRRQRNFRIVQGLVKAHDDNSGQMTARQWSTLRNMFDRFAKENRGGGFRSRVGEGMRSEVGVDAPSGRRPGSGKGPRTAKDALPENYDSMSLDEKFDALLSVGKYDEQTNPNGIQIGEYNAAFRRLREMEDEQDRIAARREALAERMKRSAEAGPITPREIPGEGRGQSEAPKVQKTPEERAAAAKRQRQKKLNAIENAVAKIQDKVSGAVIDGDADDAHRAVWDEVMDLLQQEDDGEDADLTLSKLGSIIETLNDYSLGFEGEEMSGQERRSVNNAVKLKNTLEELYDEIENDPFIPRGSTAREVATTLAGEDEDSSPTPRFMTGEGLRSRSNLVNDYIGARKNAERRPGFGMRSRTGGSVQEGRAEIRWEASEFNKVEQSLNREISEAQKAGDRKTATALRNLMQIMDRQKSGDFGGKRTNAGALYLTQKELDDVMDALMHVVDRQAQTDGSRLNMFAQLLDKLAQAGMATFIEKTAKEVNSRFVEKTNEAGRTVRIPLNE